jgi:hypothetical protein
MEYLEVVDKIDKEVSKLNAVALLLSSRSEILDGVANIIIDSADSLKKLIHQYGIQCDLIER